jgi:archaetidylinositol phosphate synthase
MVKSLALHPSYRYFCLVQQLNIKPELGVVIVSQSIALDSETIKKAEPQSVVRIQLNVLAQGERVLLNWICRHLPSSFTPDRLTLIGVAGAIIVFIGYIGSRYQPEFLWLATLGFLVHWFGDSLDGSVARYRHIERPRYGYFLDHSVDAVCNLLIMAGIGFSPYVRMDVALFALLGYFLLCMYVFLDNHVSGAFKLSFLGLGPTELRLGLVGINIWAYCSGEMHLSGFSQAFSPYDVVIGGTGVIFIGLFIQHLQRTAQILREKDELLLP